MWYSNTKLAASNLINLSRSDNKHESFKVSMLGSGLFMAQQTKGEHCCDTVCFAVIPAAMLYTSHVHIDAVSLCPRLQKTNTSKHQQGHLHRVITASVLSEL